MQEKEIATLSNSKDFTIFSYGGHCIRFKAPYSLKKYTRILRWDNGYIVVMAEYDNNQEEEEYIDLVPILENLYFDPDEFLKPIKKVRLQNE